MPIWPLATPSLPAALARPALLPKRAATACLLAGVLALGASSLAKPALAKSDDGLVQALSDIRAQDQKMQDIGWKLASANARYCAKTTLSIGLQLVDVTGYRKPDQARSAFGLPGDFAIYTIAAGSPAAQTALAPLQPLTSIDGATVDSWVAQPHSDWKRLTRAHDAIEQSLAADGKVVLALTDSREETLAGEMVCASRFELGGSDKRAFANGSRVVLGRKFPGFAYPEDELAAAIAHELAHNILAHRVWLDSNGRKRKHVRTTEREADRLMPWLLANAGYNPDAATRFMQRWGPKHGGGLLRKRSHDGWDERVEFITAEVEQIQALLSADQPANWSEHFRRETGP